VAEWGKGKITWSSWSRLRCVEGGPGDLGHWGVAKSRDKSGMNSDWWGMNSDWWGMNSDWWGMNSDWWGMNSDWCQLSWEWVVKLRCSSAPQNGSGSTSHPNPSKAGTLLRKVMIEKRLLSRNWIVSCNHSKSRWNLSGPCFVSKRVNEE